MTYNESIDYLFKAAPLFQNIGAGAYKEGLSNTHILDRHFGYPHHAYRTIHVAGTNGKGSTTHTLASILQNAGYRVGLYTSPHLVDFRERIRVNGQMIPEDRVVRFVEEERDFFEPLHPSFFELSTALAFKYFEEQRVDIAVIEVGLGGRLDCTNIITPMVSVITNISFDHTQFLGDTIEKIATEKAGVIKRGIPVVIGEKSGVADVFVNKADEMAADIFFAEDESEIVSYEQSDDGWVLNTVHYGIIRTQLSGDCQLANARTVLCTLAHLPFQIDADVVRKGFASVCTETGLMGRWQTLRNLPKVVCDTGHNVGGWKYLSSRLSEIARHTTLRIVMGMVSDKDVTHVLAMMPRGARYYFTQASVARAMPVEKFAEIASEYGLEGDLYVSVADAYVAAKNDSCDSDVIFVGGSTFVVADFLTYLSNENTVK